MKLLRTAFDLLITAVSVVLFGWVLIVTSPFWLFLGAFNLFLSKEDS